MKHKFTLSALSIFCVLLPAAGIAQSAIIEEGRVIFSLDMVFTFIFLTLGPLKIIQPFWALTRQRNTAFRNKLALNSSVVALIAVVLATTIGARILMKWHISPAAAALTAGLLLFLIALKAVMKQYAQQPDTFEKPAAAAPSETQLAFSPLAFPTIVTPYGVALLIVLVTLSPGQIVPILAITAIIFVLNFLTMLAANSIMRWSLAVALLGILGSVMGVLQVALGVQTILKALYVLGLKVP